MSPKPFFIAAFVLLAGCSNSQMAQGPYFQLTSASGDVQAVNDVYQSIYFDLKAQSLTQLNDASPIIQAEANHLVVQAHDVEPSLAAAANAAMITPPEVLNKRLQATLTQLGQLHGTAFDQAFLAAQIKLRMHNLDELQAAQPRLINSQVRDAINTFQIKNENDLKTLRSLQAKTNFS